jgi:hypothetical protein
VSSDLIFLGDHHTIAILNQLQMKTLARQGFQFSLVSSPFRIAIEITICLSEPNEIY